VRIVSVLTSASRGGAEFAAVWLLDALVERGHGAVLLTNLRGLCDNSSVVERQVNLGPKLSRKTRWRLAMRAPELALRLRRALGREWPFDVLLLHFKKEQLLMLTLPRRLRANCVWAEWGPLPHEFRSGIGGATYRAAARHVSAVLAVSAGSKTTLLQAGIPESKIAVLPNAVRAQKIHYSAEGRSSMRSLLDIPEQAFVVGLLARLHPKKRNDVVIDAVNRLQGDVHLIIAGEGETLPELKRLAMPLGPRAHFIPSPGDDAARVLSAFDVAVFCPSPTEGAPLAVILPMLVGLPVVATGGEGARDLLPSGSGRILEPENDPVALAALLEEYRRDPQLRAKEGRVARLHAEATHSPAHVAAMFERLVSGAGRRAD
jgi:glycosyltransferase involved in cell wall biosynthesis